MTASASKSWVPYVVAFAVAVLMLGVGLGRFGIWQPTELRAADAAREGAREPAQRPPLQIAAVRAGFRWFGASESGGRMPAALLAIAATMALAFAVGRASDARAGALVGIAYATMPLAFMNARQMFGGGVAQSGATLLLAAVLYIVWGRPPTGIDDEAPSERARGGAVALWSYGRYALFLSVLVALWAAGWMLGVLPVLLGVAVAIALRWRYESIDRRAVAVVLGLAGLVVAVLCARAALHPNEIYSQWTGTAIGNSALSSLPTYETLIEQIGHGLFPWTGIAAFGVVRLLVPPAYRAGSVGSSGQLVDEAAAWRESGLKVGALLTAIFAYGLQSFHWQTFGPSPFIAVAPLAVAVGLTLRDAEREAQPWRLVTAGATLFTLITFRDYMLFPKSAYAALGLPEGGPAFPSGFTVKLGEWAQSQRGAGRILVSVFNNTAPAEVYFLLAFAVFLLVALCPLFLGAGPVDGFGWKRPYTWMLDVEKIGRDDLAEEDRQLGHAKRRWPRALTGSGVLAHFRAWVAGGSLAFVVVFTSIALLARGLTTAVRGIFGAIATAPLIAVAATYGVIVLWNFFAWIGRPDGRFSRSLGSRLAFVPIGGVLVALVTTQLFVPALSEHLSPRGVWSVIRAARHGNEPVARFGGNQNDRATSYYANFRVLDLSSETDALEWLRQRTPRRFMIVGSDVFPSLNHDYRRSQPEGQRQNIPVLDATNSNLYVAVTDLEGRPSRNPLDAIVRSHDWQIAPRGEHWHPHGRSEGGTFTADPARFDDAIEYTGYNLDSNNMSYVPVGGSFKITYHFRVLREVAGSHQIFVHVDGACPRINGDHEPANGKYPLRYWLAGDYIHDEHRITIPGYCRAGTYYVYIGFFQGDDRMRVSGGDHDRENRVVAARIVVR